MFPKRSRGITLTGVLCIAAGLAIWAMAPAPAQAQCGDVPPDSACLTCHEKEAPVNAQGEWHAIHAAKDTCADCHGGNCMAVDKDQAHQGLVLQPLEDIYTDCYHCHPNDYQEKASRFGLTLGVNPGSRPTPTAVPVGPSVENPLVILPRSIPAAPASFPWSLVLGSASLVVLLLLALALRPSHLHT